MKKQITIELLNNLWKEYNDNIEYWIKEKNDTQEMIKNISRVPKKLKEYVNYCFEYIEYWTGRIQTINVLIHFLSNKDNEC